MAGMAPFCISSPALQSAPRAPVCDRGTAVRARGIQDSADGAPSEVDHAVRASRWATRPERFPRSWPRAVGHHHDTVRQQHRFVDVVRDHQHGWPRIGHDLHQLVLQRPLSASSAPNGSSISTSWVSSPAPVQCRPLLHPPRNLGGLLVLGMGQADEFQRRVRALINRPCFRWRQTRVRPQGERCRSSSSTGATSGPEK